MCISVHRRNPTTNCSPWLPRTRVIVIPAGLSPGRSLIAVRAVLTELGIPQRADGARCFCGEAVLVCRVPAQRSIEGVRVAS
jgi:hypothetical protein